MPEYADIRIGHRMMPFVDNKSGEVRGEPRQSIWTGQSLNRRDHDISLVVVPVGQHDADVGGRITQPVLVDRLTDEFFAVRDDEASTWATSDGLGEDQRLSGPGRERYQLTIETASSSSGNGLDGASLIGSELESL